MNAPGVSLRNPSSPLLSVTSVCFVFFLQSEKLHIMLYRVSPSLLLSSYECSILQLGRFLCVFPGLPWIHGMYTWRDCWISRKQNWQTSPVSRVFCHKSVLSCVPNEQTAVVCLCTHWQHCVDSGHPILCHSTDRMILPESMMQTDEVITCLLNVQSLMSTACEQAKRRSVCLG